MGRSDGSERWVRAGIVATGSAFAVALHGRPPPPIGPGDDGVGVGRDRPRFTHPLRLRFATLESRIPLSKDFVLAGAGDSPDQGQDIAGEVQVGVVVVLATGVRAAAAEPDARCAVGAGVGVGQQFDQRGGSVLALVAEAEAIGEALPDESVVQTQGHGDSGPVRGGGGAVVQAFMQDENTGRDRLGFDHAGAAAGPVTARAGSGASPQADASDLGESLPDG